MRRTLLPLLLVIAAVTACKRRSGPDPRPQVMSAMRDVIVYPMSTRVGMAAGEDAAQMTLTTTDSLNRVADWFRQALTASGWTLQSDFTSPDGSIAITAMLGERPLWLTLRPNGTTPGTTYTVIAPFVKDSRGTSEPEAEREAERQGPH